MKCLIMRTLLCNVLIITMVHASPTCIGRLDVDTPPLFSKEYEKLYDVPDDGSFDLPTHEESANEAQ